MISKEFRFAGVVLAIMLVIAISASLLTTKWKKPVQVYQVQEQSKDNPHLWPMVYRQLAPTYVQYIQPSVNATSEEIIFTPLNIANCSSADITVKNDSKNLDISTLKVLVSDDSKFSKPVDLIVGTGVHFAEPILKAGEEYAVHIPTNFYVYVTIKAAPVRGVQGLKTLTTVKCRYE
jgi:hypothetical protein